MCVCVCLCVCVCCNHPESSHATQLIHSKQEADLRRFKCLKKKKKSSFLEVTVNTSVSTISREVYMQKA